jgi:phosphoribosylanthranilate isomerase
MSHAALSFPLRERLLASQRAGLVKICGLKTEEAMGAVLDAGADLVGLVCVPGTPRYIGMIEALPLARMARGRALVTLLTVDAGLDVLDPLILTLRPDVLQLHGGESPEHVAMLKDRYDLPLIKAVGISSRDDLSLIDLYSPYADLILLDAKPPEGSGAQTGGHGRAFDWSLLRSLPQGAPIMLSGGLTPENVRDAIQITGVRAVDVSSGVESARGVKSLLKILDFINFAREGFMTTE